MKPLSLLRRMWAVVPASAVLASLAACSAGSEANSGVDETAPSTATTASPTPGAVITTRTTDDKGENDVQDNTLNLAVGDTVWTATLTDNSSVEALKELLADGPLTIDMHDYEGMEKVGPLGTDLPRNDEQITTKPGDLILYQGDALVIYYAPNSWNFTRLGRIEDVTAGELKDALGPGDVKVTLSMDRTP